MVLKKQAPQIDLQVDVLGRQGKAILTILMASSSFRPWQADLRAPERQANMADAARRCAAVARSHPPSAQKTQSDAPSSVSISASLPRRAVF